MMQLRRPRRRSLACHRVRTPTVLQYEAVECGAASLKIVLGYLGKRLPLRDLRQRCGISRDGVSAIQLKQVAQSLGLEVKAFRCSARHLQDHGRFPCILFWAFNHFLVLEGFAHGKAYLSDPAMGRRRVNLDEFAARFSGVVLELHPGDDFVADGREPGPYHLLPRLLAPYQSLWPWLALVALTAALPELFIAGALSVFVDAVLQNGRVALALGVIWITALAAAVLLLALSLQKLLLRSLSSLLLRRLSCLLSMVLFSLPYRFFLQRLQGELAQRLLLPLVLVQVGVNGMINALLSLTTGLVALVVGFWIAPSLALMTLAIAAATGALTLMLRALRSDDSLNAAMAQARTNGIGLYLLQRIESIKASGLDSDAFMQWSSSFNTALAATQKQSLVNALLGVIGSSSSFVLRCSVILLGGLLILRGQLRLGELMGFFCLVTLIETPLQRLSLLNSQLQQLDGLLGRINDIVDNDVDPQVRCFGLQHTPASPRQLRGRLELEGLGFQFSHNTPRLFEGLSLQLQPGAHLAIVGSSGSGKSTLLHLLAGLERPSEGVIRYDGRSWMDWDDATLRGSIALVSQEGFLFEGSLEENLSLWDCRISSSDALSVLAQVGLLDELGGAEALRYRLGESGHKLSGGQRQRVELARALLRQPSLLLLDEATSALDEHNERQILSSLKQTPRTLVTVAHRLHAAQISDWVLVLEQGQPVQQGHPRALAASDGPYRRLLAAEWAPAP